MIKPLGDRIVVLPNLAPETTESGLVIPQAFRERQQVGKVVAVGTGIEGESIEVQVGDEVLYGKNSGIPITFAEVEYLVIKHSDILGVL
jgi:chaperonin GroES